MKKLLLLFFSVFLMVIGLSEVYSQGGGNPNTSVLFCEDFDNLPWGMTTSGNVSTSPLFEPDSVVRWGGTGYSATDTVGIHASNGIPVQSYLTTPIIRGIKTPANISVEFRHIAYLEQFDNVFLEISLDGGKSWRLCGNNTYAGPSIMKPNGAFSKQSNLFDWKFLPQNDTNFIWTSQNAEWKIERYDLYDFIDTTTSDSMMLRIVLEDAPSSTPGRVGTHRYYIEDFCVYGSDCDPRAPELDLTDPPENYPNRFTGSVYLLGPYKFNIRATDESTVAQTYVEYYVMRDTTPNDGIQKMDTVRVDTAWLSPAGGAFFDGEIPVGHTEIGDSVFWRVVAVDGSPCAYSTYEPNQGYEEFEVRANLPVTCNTTPINSFPYYQTFDSWPTDDITRMGNDWQNVEGDFHDWWISSDTTPTANTGPTDDIPGGGQYLYVEGSGYFDSTAFLLTPCIDLFELENAKVRFYLHQLTDGTDTVWVDIFDPTPLPNHPNGKFVPALSPIGGNKGDAWLPHEFTTYKYRNTVTQIRFRARPSKLTDLSDMALDSFQISYSPLVDVRPERVIVGPYSPVDEEVPVVLNVLNQGVFPADTIKFTYEIIMDNGQLHETKSTTWYGNLPAGEGLQISLDDIKYKVPLGAYTIKAWVEHEGDEIAGNDTTQQRTRGLAYKNGSFYFDNFDTPNRDTIFTALADLDTIGNFWELGTPNFDKTNSAFTTQSYNSPYAQFNCWDILLNRGYVGDGNTVQLLSPFIDFSNAQTPYLSFFNNRDIDTTKAGVYIEYSFDRGLTWDSLTGGHDPGKWKWYNSYIAAPGFGGQPVFAYTTKFMEGNWNGWVETELKLPSFFAGKEYVLFRFNFFAEDFSETTSGFNYNDGMSIDNFLVYDEVSTDLEVQHILQPFNECYMTSSERFLTAVKNRGTSAVGSFDLTYIVKHISTGNTVTKTETVNRTIQPRDTVIVKSESIFDMRALNDYEVKVIVSIDNDGYPQNDTAVKYVEHIDGCSMIFQAVTEAYKRPPIVDSSYWRFDYISGGRQYYITDDYTSFNPFDTNRVEICIRKDAMVTFNLGDVDTAIVDYTLYAYDGEEDTVIVNQEPGGSDAPPQNFNWICPPEVSATPIEIFIDNNSTGQLPIAKEYMFDMKIRNNGLDSIAHVTIGISVDGEVLNERSATFIPPLEYNEKSTLLNIGPKYLDPGPHIIKAWTHAPNGNQDEIPSDDTISRRFVVLDTAIYGNGSRWDDNMQQVQIKDSEYCTDFEGDDSIRWVGLKFPTLEQSNLTFELGTPSTQNITGPRSGNIAWVTNANGNYVNFDSSTVLSPFIEMQRDSCYQLEFYHNYSTAGKYNDGGQILMSLDMGQSWENQNRRIGAVGDTGLQQGWYNTRHVIAIENNNVNSGWSGNSSGWVKAQTFIPSYENSYALFAFRFASDGNEVSDGWAFDDFCIRKIDAMNCFALGVGEEMMDLSKLYLGQNVPNPAMDFIEIPYYIPENGNVHFEITNMVGQKVYSEVFSKPRGNHLIQMDISNLSAGVYYYWIVFDDIRLSKKMIITE